MSCGNNTFTWNDRGNYRWAKIDPGNTDDIGFTRLPSSTTGIHFENHLSEEAIKRNQHYMNGSGVAAGDVDGDGRTDLYFARLEGPNRLYRNVGGVQFEEVTDSAGVAHEGYYSTGTTFADIDGDGDLDLLVGSISKGVVVYINDGRGHFTRHGQGPLEERKGNMTFALADVEGDGDLDLYVSNYKEKPVKDIYSNDKLAWEKTIRTKQTDDGPEQTVIPPFDEHYTIIKRRNAPNSRRETGERDALYLNAGDGTYRKVDPAGERFRGPDGAPRGLALDWGLNASFRDVNGDGRPDLYVNNDFWTPDRLWINQGGGVFRAVARTTIRNSSFSSMTVDFSDVNRDGSLDFFVTEMLSPKHSRRLRQFNPTDPFPANRLDSRPQYNRNSFYFNRGDGTYAETSYYSGLEATEWSWGIRFLDLNLDGYEDLLVNTGYSYDFQDLDSQRKMGRKMARTRGSERYLTEYPQLHLKNKAYHNDGDLTFSDRSGSWGFGIEKDVSHGLATADFDRDGDLDVVVSRLNDTAVLYENEAGAARIAVRPLGRPANTQAIGAKIQLEGGKGGPAPQKREITAGGNYLSGSAPQVMFAADPENSAHRITVTWPNGKQSTIDSVKANRIYEIREPKGTPKGAADSTLAAVEGTNGRTGGDPIFKDGSARLSHEHNEASYDDYRIQPLLPHKLSQQGPGVAWVDYDQDGDDDLFVAAGRGGRLALYENEGRGEFRRRRMAPMTDSTRADQTTILGWPTEGGTDLLVGQANYEPGDVDMRSVVRYKLRAGAVTGQGGVPGILSTAGPLAAADYDSDGDMDVFVGGRFVPAQYPKDATSRLFKQEDGQFVLDDANAGLFEDLGLVTGAVFTDYDQDGDQDFLVSRAWDSLKLFRNDDGRFRDVTEGMGLAQYDGWWNGVTTGDFNGDGRPDIVATNWGTNTPYQLDSARPLRMYYEDFNRDRRVEIIEAYYEPEVDGYVPRRKLSAFESTPVPFSDGVSSNAQFSSSNLRSLLGVNPDGPLRVKEVNTVAHMLFLNKGGHFVARPLPRAAQLATAFHAGVGDYNSDGKEDLFLSQNFFEVRPEMPRSDAGRGLLLQGDGEGGFEAIRGHESGITVYGEQRGAAFGDFNADGRVDLVVSQNDTTTKLYVNGSPHAGLTVQLDGPSWNEAGFGSSLRLLYEDGRTGPRREIQAGGGYWSQGSASQVMGRAGPVDHIEVTWFDGRVDTVNVSKDRRAYRIPYPQ